MLNSRQRKLLLFGLVLVSISFLYPNWELKENGTVTTSRYEPIVSPPKAVGWELDYTRLFSQIGIVVIVTGGAILLSKK